MAMEIFSPLSAGIRENELVDMHLPDPYHVKPEDFLHDSDLLHLSTAAADSQHTLNRNISAAKSPRKHKSKVS